MLHGGLLLVEEYLGDLLVDVGKSLDKLFASLLRDEHDVRGDVVGFDNVLASCASVIDGFHVHEVDDAFELAFIADRDLHCCRGDFELMIDLIDALEGVGAHAVHLVDEDDTGNIIPSHLSVDRDRLRLHTRDGAKNHDGPIEHSQRAFDFDGEINVPRRIDEVDVVVFLLPVLFLDPVTKRGCGLNSNTLFPLKVHRVHLGANRVLAANFMYRIDPTCIKQDALGGGSLPAVDVRLRWVSQVTNKTQLTLMQLYIQRYRYSALWTSGPILLGQHFEQSFPAIALPDSQ